MTIDIAGIFAIVGAFGMAPGIVYLRNKHRLAERKLELEAMTGASTANNPKLLEENRLLRERVENLESIVCNVDFEINQKIKALLEQSQQVQLPLPAPVVVPTAVQPVGTAETMGEITPVRPRVSHGAELRVGDTLIGRYRIQRLLGRGGMGAVYLADDEVLGEMVALKVISGMGAPSTDAVARFRGEAAAARKISSPNVIRIHDLGEAPPSMLYLSMEYFPGRTLSDVMTQRGLVTITACRDYLQQICVGLEAAHHVGVVHRDLKPGNVLVGERGAVTLIDFGLAKANVGDGLTATGVLLGTPLYMAPEQIRGKSVDARTDIYSLGALAYHLVTGRPPVNGDNAIAVGFAHLSEVPVAAKSLRADIPESWNTMIMAALAKLPNDRPSSATEFAAALT